MFSGNRCLSSESLLRRRSSGTRTDRDGAILRVHTTHRAEFNQVRLVSWQVRRATPVGEVLASEKPELGGGRMTRGTRNQSDYAIRPQVVVVLVAVSAIAISPVSFCRDLAFIRRPHSAAGDEFSRCTR